jgi:hypothetical protein
MAMMKNLISEGCALYLWSCGGTKDLRSALSFSFVTCQRAGFTVHLRFMIASSQTYGHLRRYGIDFQGEFEYFTVKYFPWTLD